MNSHLPASSSVTLSRLDSKRSNVPASCSSSKLPPAPVAENSKNMTAMPAAYIAIFGLCLSLANTFAV